MARDDKHSYNSGRIHRAGTGEAGTPARAGASTAVRKPKKKKNIALRVVAIVLIVILGIALAGVLYALIRVDKALDPGITGKVDSGYYTPKEYKGDVINILITGIFRDDPNMKEQGLGLTDMILYVNYDLKNNKMNILQIPRDSFVDESIPSGGEGKLNGVMYHGPDKENPINNLVDVIANQYQLPVDRYINVDMEALKEIVDIFNGLYVYVPKEMSYDGSYLAQGWQWLDSGATEFFVRNRKGTGFERADIDRLENQRYFYSALFRRFMNLSVSNIMGLLPVFEHRCNTDFALTDLYDLAVTAMNLDANDVTFITVPGATKIDGVWEADPYRGRDVFITVIYGRGTETEPGLANILNNYFRTYAETLTDAELAQKMIDGGMYYREIPGNVPLYTPAIRSMGDVQEDEGGANIDVEPGNDW